MLLYFDSGIRHYPTSCRFEGIFSRMNASVMHSCCYCKPKSLLGISSPTLIVFKTKNSCLCGIASRNLAFTNKHFECQLYKGHIN